MPATIADTMPIYRLVIERCARAYVQDDFGDDSHQWQPLGNFWGATPLVVIQILR